MSDRACGRGDRLISVSARFGGPPFELQSWGRHRCRSRFCRTGTPALAPGLGLNACRSFALETERREQHHAIARLLLEANRGVPGRKRLVWHKTVTQNLSLGIDAEPDAKIPTRSTCVFAFRIQDWMMQTDHPSQRVACDRPSVRGRLGPAADFDGDERAIRKLGTVQRIGNPLTAPWRSCSEKSRCEVVGDVFQEIVCFENETDAHVLGCVFDTQNSIAVHKLRIGHSLAAQREVCGNPYSPTNPCPCFGIISSNRGLSK